MGLRENADKIISYTIKAALPDSAVQKALQNKEFSAGKVILVAAGKGAWQMAKAAHELLGDEIDEGIVITKYDHAKGAISNLQIYEAGHPIPDDNSFEATQKAIDMVSSLSSEDTVLFLLSGGGSALFEKPLVDKKTLETLTSDLLMCGADIVEINTLRKRLSAVKGGRFANICEPANVFSIVLSDIIGDPLDMIASGPAYPDSSTCKDAMNIVKKYNLVIDEETEKLLNTETPKEISNVETLVTGSVKQLCLSAQDICSEMGYETHILADSVNSEAREVGAFLASVARYNSNKGRKIAYILGGETVVHITGTGKGGRNQEIALGAAEGIAGLTDVCVFSVGSDGTDGPTDAAGGYCDGHSKEQLLEKNILISDILKDNNAYFALKSINGLVMTGATGTNVNDFCVLLIDG